MRVAVVCLGRKDVSYAGYELLVENLTGNACVSDTVYSVIRTWGEFFLRDFSAFDAVLVHGAYSGIWLPYLKRRCTSKVILHVSEVIHAEIGNLWGIPGRMLEKRAVENADIIVADNRSIAVYLSETYGRAAEVIAYGGNHFRKKLSSVLEEDFLAGHHLDSGGYALAMCPLTVDNNCEAILEAFSRSLEPLVFIGDWENGNCPLKLKRRFGSFPNIFLLNHDEAPDMMYMAMKNCRLFVCGHGAEGTDLMLVGAMSMGKPVICYDSPSNRSSTRNMAHYFRNFQDILKLIFVETFNGGHMYAVAQGMYDWKYINKKYQALYER